jgi:response regulator RpfG family c-di-GMP phosphodiesterase
MLASIYGKEAGMSEKILFVDDEPQVLQAIKRQLRKRFDLSIAESGLEALEILKTKGPFAVVVSDMRMPGMDGLALLTQVKVAHPDTVRMMLTGNADQETAADAVNKGQVFRFLTKPCSTAIMVPALALALRHYRLITAEKELLNETLRSSIGVMSELLTLANATAFSLGPRIKPMVIKLAEALGLFPAWQYEVSASMSQLGCITMPNDLMHKVHAGIRLSGEEWQTYRKHPNTAGRMISQIPRLEKVTEIIVNQLTEYGNYEDDTEEDVALGGQILKVAIEYDLLRQQDVKHDKALRIMRRRKGWYNPAILALVEKIKPPKRKVEIKNVRFKNIVAGMIADVDVMAKNGTLLIPKDQKITWSIIESLANFVRHVGIEEPIRVRTFME